MILEKLRRFWKKRPFRPFVIHLSDGQALQVAHPDCMAVGHDLVFVSELDGDDHFATFDQIVSIRLPRRGTG